MDRLSIVDLKGKRSGRMFAAARVLVLLLMAQGMRCAYAADDWALPSPKPPETASSLQGFVGLRSDSSLQKGATDSTLRGKVEAASANILHANANDATLHGQIEERNKLDRLFRPMNLDPLSRSVKVLAGENANMLKGQAEDVSLDSALKADNFSLKAQNPQFDKSALGGGLHRLDMPAQFTWAITDGGGIFMWNGFNQSGIGAGGLFDSGYITGFTWDPCFEMKRTQSSITFSDANLNFQPAGNLMPDGTRTSIGWRLPNSDAPRMDETDILWDTWYQRISRSLYSQWHGKDGLPGDATLHITVRRGRKIEAQIVRCNNSSPSFKQGLMAAVAALNNNPALDFPRESRKQIVSFDSLFSAGPSTIAGAFSDRHGETEQLFRGPAR